MATSPSPSDAPRVDASSVDGAAITLPYAFRASSWCDRAIASVAARMSAAAATSPGRAMSTSSPHHSPVSLACATCERMRASSASQ